MTHKREPTTNGPMDIATADLCSMRFKLTEKEHRAVEALKRACDDQKIRYKSIFELAKYVLVCHSSYDDKKEGSEKAAQKRLALAMKRLKQIRRWEVKYGLDSVDVFAAIKDIEAVEPNYYINHYTTDREGHVVVAHSISHPLTSFIFSSKENLAKYMATEAYRSDLAAADMMEARQGIAIVNITDKKITFSTGLQYWRQFGKAHEFFYGMHSHRIRKIYSQIPPLLTSFVAPAKVILPKKMAQRLQIFSSIDKLDAHVLKAPAEDAPKSAYEWALKRKAVHDTTCYALNALF